MTEQTYTTWAPDGPRSGMQSLWRLAVWGTLASVSLFFAVISAYSNTGARRLAAAAGSSQPVGGQASDQETAQQRSSMADGRAQSINNAEETRRLSEAVRALAADRDQLSTRVTVLERNLDSVTGSVKRPPPPATQPSPLATNAAPAGRAEAPMTTNSTATSSTPAASMPTSSMTAGPMTAGPVAAASAPGTNAPPSPPEVTAQSTQQAAGPTEAGKAVIASAADATRPPAAEPLPPPGLGVDVGGAANFDGLRALWHTTKNNDPSLLDDFYPVVATRENSKTHAAELRLIVGPMPDAEAAAQLCVTLAAAHQYCQPVAFEGQRLSVADAGKGMPARHRAPATQPVTGLKVVPAYPTGK